MNINSINNQQIIIQEERIITDDKYNMILEINPTVDTNYYLDPYFKVYINKNYRANNHSCARIAILRPEYIIHQGSIKLDRKQVSFMINLLKRDYDSIHTVWKYMCYRITELANQSGFKNIDYKNLEMPDYTILYSK